MIALFCNYSIYDCFIAIIDARWLLKATPPLFSGTALIET